jgi:hypothetical protein
MMKAIARGALALCLSCTTSFAATLVTETIDIGSALFGARVDATDAPEVRQSETFDLLPFDVLFPDAATAGAVLESVRIRATMPVRVDSRASLFNTSILDARNVSGSVRASISFSVLGETSRSASIAAFVSCIALPLRECRDADTANGPFARSLTFTDAADLSALASGAELSVDATFRASVFSGFGSVSGAGSARFSALAEYTYVIPDAPAPIPLPAGLPLALTALGTLAHLARRKRA